MVDLRVHEYKNSNFIFGFRDDRLTDKVILCKIQLNDSGGFTKKVHVLSDPEELMIPLETLVYDLLENMKSYTSENIMLNKYKEFKGNLDWRFNSCWNYISSVAMSKLLDSNDLCTIDLDFNGLIVRITKDDKGSLYCSTSSRLWMKSPITSFVFNTFNEKLKDLKS